MENICVDCNEIKNTEICSVCSRPICKECSDLNNEKYSRSEVYKMICDYCGCIYWRGF